MAKLDPFSAQIVQLVRRMPDDAILALVRGQLGVDGGVPDVTIASTGRRAGRSAARRRGAKAQATGRPAVVRVAAKRGSARPKRRTTAARLKVLADVERVVKAGKGLSASEVARATGVGQVRVATALRELKLAKRIHQGGDRRFARYAADKSTAEAASLRARRNAKGPILKKKAARKGKKR